MTSIIRDLSTIVMSQKFVTPRLKFVDCNQRLHNLAEITTKRISPKELGNATNQELVPAVKPQNAMSDSVMPLFWGVSVAVGIATEFPTVATPEEVGSRCKSAV